MACWMSDFDAGKLINLRCICCNLRNEYKNRIIVEGLGLSSCLCSK